MPRALSIEKQSAKSTKHQEAKRQALRSKVPSTEKAKCQASHSTMYHRVPHTEILDAQNLCAKSLKVTSFSFFTPPEPKPN
jgi:hypothetical protein